MKALILAILLVGTFSLHAQIALTPLELNDRLTDITDGANKRGQEWGVAFNAAYEAKDYSKLRPLREATQSFLYLQILEVSAMDDVGNSKALRTAMIEFLRFELRLAADALQPFEKLTASSTPEEVKSVYDSFKLKASTEASELEKVAVAQAAYAKENNFGIETDEAAEERRK